MGAIVAGILGVIFFTAGPAKLDHDISEQDKLEQVSQMSDEELDEYCQSEDAQSDTDNCE